MTLFDVNGTQVQSVKQFPSMPDKTWYSGYTQYENDIYVVGGRTPAAAISNKVLVLRSGAWDVLPYLNTARDMSCVFVLNDRLYAAGGGQSLDIESLDLRNTDSGWKKESLTLPVGISACAVIGDSVYISYDNYLMKSDMQSEFVYLNNMTYSRSGHCMVSDGEANLWTLGGSSTLNVEMYSVASGEWTVVTSIPHYQHDLSLPGCVYFEGYIYVVGGLGSPFYSDRIYIYDPDTHTWGEGFLGVGLVCTVVGIIPRE